MNERPLLPEAFSNKSASEEHAADHARQLLPCNQVATLTTEARAEALSWAPNTRRAYTAGWTDFAQWTLQNRCPGLPATPETVSRYLEHLIEVERKSMATARISGIVSCWLINSISLG